LTPTASGFALTDSIGPLGTDHLSNIERVVFSDRATALDIDGHAGQVYRLYQVFDRAPDLAGEGFWIAALDGGTALSEAAGYFVASPEYAHLFGTAPTAVELVAALYRNVLHREPEAAGLAFWNAAIGGHHASAADALLAFTESAEHKAQVLPEIAHGIDFILFA
ncbi:MAG TPA: DUF4214 domain-containing protein, partial [Telluria sp.]|nr:DUF4214 domain-containing protein [Telluria sp.]